MLIFNKQSDLIAHLKSYLNVKTTIGFVPTMGALHQGHLSLLKQSFDENEITVLSIFVNPTQFNNAQDLAKYPRTIDSDVVKIKSISDKTIIYTPTEDDIYHGNAVAEHFDFDGLEHQMEGQFRPGHFDGVGTIVKRLFEIVKPTNAYFGEKDFQQLQIVKNLVKKQKLPVNIIECPIFREESGLAMSSRNQNLSEKEKKEAALIYKILKSAKIKFGTISAKEVSKWVVNEFKKNTAFELEYFQIADESTLLPCFRKNKKNKYRAFIAVFVNKTRLIDTISLN